MNGRRLAVSSILVLSVAGAAPAAADPISVTQSVTFATWSGNGHRYAVVPAEFLTWDQASMAVKALLGPAWDLATITGVQEQNFVSSLALSGVEYWLGGFQAPFTVPADAGWTWVTNEPFAYTKWATFEPNDVGGPASEQHLGMWGADAGTLVPFPRPRGTWNDEDSDYSLISGYVAETATPTPEPATLLLVATGIAGGYRLRRRSRSTSQRHG